MERSQRVGSPPCNQGVARGKLPNPGIGLASEFASTRIFYKRRFGRQPNDQEFLDYTRALARQKNWEVVGNVPGIDPRKNAFFGQLRVRYLPADAVLVVVSHELCST